MARHPARGEPAPVAVTAEAASAVDLDAISDEEIERLLGSETRAPETAGDRRSGALAPASCKSRCRLISAFASNNGSKAVKRSFIH